MIAPSAGTAADLHSAPRLRPFRLVSSRDLRRLRSRVQIELACCSSSTADDNAWVLEEIGAELEARRQAAGDAEWKPVPEGKVLQERPQTG